ELLEVPAVHREGADEVAAATGHGQRGAVWRQPRVDGAEAVVELSGAQKRERTVIVDRVAGYVRRAGVDCEQVFAIVGDFDPAGSGLVVRVGRRSDRGQDAVRAVLER